MAMEAVRLAELLKGKGIAAIFVTATKRSRETAQPLATATGAPVETYDPRDNAALATRAAAIPGSILIVGHSNTVPAIVAAVGGTPPGPMTEEDFGRIFAVERSSGKTVESRRRQLNAPTFLQRLGSCKIRSSASIISPVQFGNASLTGPIVARHHNPCSRHTKLDYRLHL